MLACVSNTVGDFLRADWFFSFIYSILLQTNDKPIPPQKFVGRSVRCPPHRQSIPGRRRHHQHPTSIWPRHAPAACSPSGERFFAAPPLLGFQQTMPLQQQHRFAVSWRTVFRCNSTFAEPASSRALSSHAMLQLTRKGTCPGGLASSLARFSGNRWASVHCTHDSN